MKEGSFFYEEAVNNKDIHNLMMGSKQEEEYIKAVYCHPADLTYMQSTS